MIVAVMRKDLVRQSSSSKKMNILENMLSVDALIEPAQTIGGVVPRGQDRLLFFLLSSRTIQCEQVCLIDDG